MSFSRPRRLSATGWAIVASAAVATLVLMVCSAVLVPQGWPPSLTVRSEVVAETGGSWGAAWESLAREPVQYQREALASLGRTVWQIGLCAELIAALSLILHAVSHVAARWRELTIRTALGAPLRSLMRLAGGELLRLGAAGVAAGATTGVGALAMMRAAWPVLLSVVPLPGPAVVAAALALVTVSLLLAAITLAMLALLQRGTRLASQLHGIQVTRGSGFQFLQSTLAALQVAALLVVTYACTLILNASALPVGHQAVVGDAESILVASADLAAPLSPVQRRAVYRHALSNNPGGARVALASPDAWLGLGKELPVIAFCGDCRHGSFFIPMSSAKVRVVAMSPDVLEPLVSYHERGRDFGFADTAGARRVAIINLAALRQLFPGTRTALGKTIRTSLSDPLAYTVVGVTPLLVPETFGNPAHTPVMYVPLLQHPPSRVEASAPAEQWDVVTQLAGAPADVLRLEPPRTLAQRLRDLAAPIQWFAVLFAGLSVAATGTATWSMVAVMYQAVRLRERDIAIRVALGASPRHIEAWVRNRGIRIVVAGAMIGLSGARGVGVLMRGADHAGDIGWLGALLLGFGALGLVASWLPARRAARVLPAAVFAKREAA